MIVYDNSTIAYANSRTHKNKDLEVLHTVLATFTDDFKLSLEKNYDFDAAIVQLKQAFTVSTEPIKNRFAGFQDFAGGFGFNREELKTDIYNRAVLCL